MPLQAKQSESTSDEQRTCNEDPQKFFMANHLSDILMVNDPLASLAALPSL